MWITPGLHTAWMNMTLVNSPANQKPAWLTDPLLTETYSPLAIEEHWGEKFRASVRFDAHEFELQSKNTMALRAAGMKVVMGTDTGQTRHLIGYFNHTVLESYVAMGMTPAETIVAATRDSAEIAKVNSGLIAPGRNADFIVLDANPLEQIGNSRRISKVYLRGEEVPRAAMAAKWRSQFRTAAAR
jgi:adenine deaminase